MTTNPNPADAALMEQVAKATPEQMAAMLLGAAERFLGQAVDAMKRKDYLAKWQAVDRVAAVLEEMGGRLNLEEGGELAANLLWVYDWWTVELHMGATRSGSERLEALRASMNEVREAWEQAHASRRGPQSFEARPAV